MNCPACGSSMVERDLGAAHVDVCAAGCRSLWFDVAELARLDERHEGAGRALRDALDSPRSNPPERARLECPRCGTPMVAHLYQRSKEVNVDECYNCGGFFLDSGELRQIRDTYMSDADVEAYKEKLLTESARFTDARAALDARKQRAEAVLRWTRWLRLSYWIGEG